METKFNWWRFLAGWFLVALYMLLWWLLSGCSASWHMKKALYKDPTILTERVVVQVDTVWRTVEAFDTVIQVKTEYDTVKYVKDSTIVELVKLPGDSIWVEVDCPDCPEVTKIETKTNTIVIKPTFWERIKSAFWILLAMAGIYFAIRIIKQFI